jgi:hypothetical protein
VRMPPLRIAENMAVVAVTAVDFGMLVVFLNDAMSEDRSRSDPAWLLMLGALPMANILAVALLIAYRRHASGPFLLRIVGFGGIALTGYSATAKRCPDILNLYIWFFLQYLPYPHAHPPWSFGLVLLASVVVLVLPQLIFSLLCGVAVRKLNESEQSPK